MDAQLDLEAQMEAVLSARALERQKEPPPPSPEVGDVVRIRRTGTVLNHLARGGFLGWVQWVEQGVYTIVFLDADPNSPTKIAVYREQFTADEIVYVGRSPSL